MTASLEQIDRDLDALRQAAQSLTQTGEQHYKRYLERLGRAVRQQMILASYHVCTQVYPEHFLQLSIPERQQFQEQLKHLAAQTETALKNCWSAPPMLSFPVINFAESYIEAVAADSTPLPTGENVPEMNLPETNSPSTDSPGTDSPGTNLPETDLPDSFPQTDWQPSGSVQFEVQSDIEVSEPQLPEPDWTVMPSVREILEELKQAQANTEAQIAEILHKASKKLDQHLQSAKVLPATPLEMVLEIAAKAEAVGRPVTRNPNLLTAMVDTPSERDPDHAPSHESAVIAVYLQLGEIEFNDTALMAERNQLRKFSAQLEKLDQRIHKKLREQQTILAANAWQSTWEELR
jgi:hypothetical protein